MTLEKEDESDSKNIKGNKLYMEDPRKRWKIMV